MRSNYVIRNSTWGIISQICNIIFGFVGRTVFIYFLGGDYLGISGLFTNILNILSLSELGFSTAVAFNLYKPLASGENKKVSAIMNFYKKVYRIIAMIIFVSGIIVIPFLKYLIKESPFEIDFLTFVYFLYLLKTVTSYLFSYNYTLATADQHNYILVNIDTISRVAMTIINTIILFLTHNYVIYLLSDIVTSIVINMIKSFVVRKRYPILREKEKLNKEDQKKIITDVKNIFLGKKSPVIGRLTDNIIISAFINTLSVGIYDNYNMLINYINGFITQLTSSTQASLGNIFATETKEYAVICIKRMMFITFIPVSICVTSLFCSLNPFIELWIGSKYVKSQAFVGIIVLNFFIMAIRTPLWQGVTASGLFKKDKIIAIIGAISNLLISLALVKNFDIAGVILGTVISQIIQLILKAKLLYNDYFKCSCFKYFMLLTKYLLIIVIQTFITFSFSKYIVGNDSILKLFVSCLFNLIFCLMMIFILFRKTDEFNYTKNLILSVLRKVRIKIWAKN